MELPYGVKYIIERLRAAGYRADAVGGAVRDLFIGRACDDYDVTTSALPEEVKRVFEGERIIETGIKHGTVTLLLSGVGYEITTYRVDGEYLDSRHPESVSFTDDLTEDLKRRDFTMNAICYNHIDGYFDPFGGRRDIEAGIIRAVGEPVKRFSEDALRIMRAVRFRAVLGFTVEEKTDRALREGASLMKAVSRERIYTEWVKLLAGKYAAETVREYISVLTAAIPELRYARVEQGFSSAPASARFPSLFAYMGVDGAAIFGQACRGLKTDRDTSVLGQAALCLYATADLTTLKGIRFAVMNGGMRAAELAIRIMGAVGGCAGDSMLLLEKIKREALPCSIQELAIDGSHLLALGYRGQRIGQILQLLLIEVIEGRVENTETELAALVSTFK